MGNRTVNYFLAVTAILVVLLLFVSYRARAFHYCFAFSERGQPRVLTADEPCNPDEQPLEWEILGGASKVRLVGNTIVKAFGAN